jgi:hypothetical protein
MTASEAAPVYDNEGRAVVDPPSLPPPPHAAMNDIDERIKTRNQRLYPIVYLLQYDDFSEPD